MKYLGTIDTYAQDLQPGDVYKMGSNEAVEVVSARLYGQLVEITFFVRDRESPDPFWHRISVSRNAFMAVQVDKSYYVNELQQIERDLR